MKVLKHIINWTVWTLVSLYAVVMIAIRIPRVQQYIGEKAAQAVGEKLGTKVEVGQIDLGFLNRLILDDVVIYDQQQQRMISAARITAKIDFSSPADAKKSPFFKIFAPKKKVPLDKDCLLCV